jgi:hypothetical protein
MAESNSDKPSSSIAIPVIAGLAIGISFVLLFTFIIIPKQLQPSKTDVGLDHPLPSKLQSEEEFILSNLKPGHSLYALTSFGAGDGKVSITVANPTNNHTFENCRVIQEIIRPVAYERFIQQTYGNNGTDDRHRSDNILSQGLNVTLKEYEHVPPHFVDNFERPIVPSNLMANASTKDNTTLIATATVVNNNSISSAVPAVSQYADAIGQSSWYIFECTKPYEAVAFPWITIGGDRVYSPGDTVHVRGIVGFSEVTIHIRNGNDVFLEKRIQTIREGGGIFDYSITIPSDAKEGSWSVEVETPDGATLGFQFGVR